MCGLEHPHVATGRISRLFSRDGTSTSNGVITETYTYDQVGRLLVANGARDGSGPASYGTLTWFYDEAGNRVQEGNTKYFYGKNNMLEFTANAATPTVPIIDYGWGAGGRAAA